MTPETREAWIGLAIWSMLLLAPSAMGWAAYVSKREDGERKR